MNPGEGQRERIPVVLLACVLPIYLLAACGSPRHEPLADPDEPGALLGAYVSPSQGTDPARITALESFEGTLGRQLDVVQIYHEWQAPFPTTFDRYVADRGDVLLLSWAGAKPSDIVEGGYD